MELADRRKGKPRTKGIALATVEKVLSLYHETYYDLNIRHFHEKLREDHGIRLSYTWVQKALQGVGLVAKRRKRGPHWRRRPRRPMPGMLLHIDGSKHRWLNDDRWHDLIVILDDAISEIYIGDQLRRRNVQSCGDTQNGPQRGVHLRPLQHGDVGSVVAALKSQGFLATGHVPYGGSKDFAHEKHTNAGSGSGCFAPHWPGSFPLRL